MSHLDRQLMIRPTMGLDITYPARLAQLPVLQPSRPLNCRLLYNCRWQEKTQLGWLGSKRALYKATPGKGENTWSRCWPN